MNFACSQIVKSQSASAANVLKSYKEIVIVKSHITTVLIESLKLYSG